MSREQLYATRTETQVGRAPSSLGLPEIPTLVTERLRLRALRSSDVDDYAALNADPEVLQHLVGAGQQPWDRGRSWRHLAFLLGHWQLGGAGMWAVEHRETGAFLGVIMWVSPRMISL